MQKAKLLCPKCKIGQIIDIPENSCLQFYICSGCGYTFSAKECCIICDYTDKKCSLPKTTKKKKDSLAQKIIKLD